MKSVTRKRYTAEFKAQAVELVGLGKPVAEVAKELEIGTSLLYRWVLKGGVVPAQLGSEGLRVPQARDEEPVADELRRLRRENGHLKLENDILKKAAIILGTRPLPAAMR
jgi:transposase